EDPGEERRAERGPPGSVAWPVERVVETPVAGDAPLERGPEVEEREDDQREGGAAPERVRDEGVAADRQVEARNQAQRADQPAEVPVGLPLVRRLGDVVRPPEPDRVDL